MDARESLEAALSGRYDVEREIGAGGMATVYLARDVKHDRRVALKVLRPELGAVLGKERFLAEIQLTAHLQHPNLLPLFDSGEAGGSLYYVMPYVEGESLRTRLDREKQLPVEEALRIAAAVAAALDYAHRQGVVHRDLKPENVLLSAGQPLLADFGIALAVSLAGGERITQTGLSLGTPQYMSPEQATGDLPVDARSDLYSLAAVTYEMLAGEPPHTGRTVQATLAKVLTERPPALRSRRPAVPVHVEAGLLKALEKLPADRFASAGEFAEGLSGRRVVGAIGAGSMPRAGGRPRRAALERGMAWGGWAAAVIATLGAASMWLAPATGLPQPPALLEVTFADDVGLSMDLVGPTIALSPDGALLAFVGVSDGVPGIYVRPLGSRNVSFLRGTEGARLRGFSPDGEWILFTAGGQQQKVRISGGAPISIVQGATGSTWTERDEIVYRGGPGLFRISSQGGTPVLLALTDTVRGHSQYAYPHGLPGGGGVLVNLYRRTSNEIELALVTIPAGEVIELGIPGTSPRYLEPGYIVFAREDGTLWAAPFSLERLRVTGEPIPVLDGIFVRNSTTGTPGSAEFTLSRNGTLVYRAGGSSAGGQLVAVQRNGMARPMGVPPGMTLPSVSADGRRIALVDRAWGDVWIHDLVTSTSVRLTTDGINSRPVWAPDGQRIAYISSRDRGVGFGVPVWRRWDEPGAHEVLVQSDRSIWEVSFDPTGKYVALRYGTHDIGIADGVESAELQPFVATPALENKPAISPDGTLLAYVSNESGRSEVYVLPLPEGRPRLQVSNQGGDEPAWSRDGTELFYRSPTHVVAAAIQRAPQLDVSRREELFRDAYQRSAIRANYDVLPGGELLMVGGIEDWSRLFAILNWTEELRRRFEGRP